MKKKIKYEKAQILDLNKLEEVVGGKNQGTSYGPGTKEQKLKAKRQSNLHLCYSGSSGPKS